MPTTWSPIRIWRGKIWTFFFVVEVWPGQFFFPRSDYNEFLEDLEEDPALRQNVNIFKVTSKSTVAVDSNDQEDDSGAPRITLEEMLDDLVIGDEEEMD